GRGWAAPRRGRVRPPARAPRAPPRAWLPTSVLCVTVTVGLPRVLPILWRPPPKALPPARPGSPSAPTAWLPERRVWVTLSTVGPWLWMPPPTPWLPPNCPPPSP